MFEVLFALLPMVILIIAMGICKWPGDKSSLLTLVITVMLATFAFGIPTREIGFTLINSTARACITILSVIWMAVFSYNILLDSGKIEVLKDQLATISTDRSVQVLLITWGFGGLLEGMPGYGSVSRKPFSWKRQAARCLNCVRLPFNNYILLYS